jgi:hypothetical protein
MSDDQTTPTPRPLSPPLPRGEGQGEGAPDWLDEIALEDLPKPHADFIELVGDRRAALHLSGKRGGEYMYVPKLDKVLIVLRDRKIRREFTGDNHRDLVRKFHLSDTWIRKILAEGDPVIDDRQAALFPAEPPLPP